MIGGLPPKPFGIMVTARKNENQGAGHVYLCDANGRKIGVLWGNPEEKMAMVDLILEARERQP